uniref:ARAD1C39226p n=1 Tax=Blastobotrys adeninivorans TaxID=409370 RepID=A0A060T3B3_BLAAD
MDTIANPLVEPVSRDPNDVRDIVYTATTIQVAGIYIQLPQSTVICSAITFVYRFAARSETPIISLPHLSRAALNLACKVHEVPRSERQIHKAIAYAHKCLLGEDSLIENIQDLAQDEHHLLRVLSFDTHVSSPYSLLMSYLQVTKLHRLGSLTELTWALTNDCIRCCAFITVTHQPNLIAGAVLGLALKRLQMSIRECEWWIIFDIETTQLNETMEMIDRSIAQWKDWTIKL